MSAYSNFVLTNKGVALLNNIINGNGILEFRYLATGSGEYAAEDKGTVSIRELEALKQERQQTAFAYIGETEEGLVNLKADVTNNDLTEGYYLTEVGIYAGKSGEEESILYCVSTATEADYMPDFIKKIPYNVVFDVRIGIGDVEKVTIAYQPDTYALAADFKAHTDDIDNPHQVTKAQVGLRYADNTADMDKPVSTAQQEAIDTAYQQATAYADNQISKLINGAPSTLDTLKEIADAIEQNEDVVEALDQAVGSKAAQEELDGHTGNTTIHITASERDKWNGKLDIDGDSSNTTVAFKQASTRTAINSGEKLAVLLGKIKKWFADLKTVAFSGSYNDLSDRPSIPTKTSDLTNDSGYKTTDNNTTYALSKTGKIIIFTGSDGSKTEINIAPENIGALSGMAATWLPSNGYNLLEHFKETAVQIYSVNPNLMISQGCPTGLSEYASVICFGVSVYVVMLYIDVFGKLAIWNSNQNKWQGISHEGHIHDDRYYTESEIDSKLSGKAGISHTHNYAGSPSEGGGAYTVYLPRYDRSADEALSNAPNAIAWIEEFGPGAGTPDQNWYQILINHSVDSLYGSQLAMGMTTNELFFRCYCSGQYDVWRQVSFVGHTHDYIPTSASCNKNWNWQGLGGQPNWIWGGNDGTNMYVYNPSSFSVNYANSAGSVAWDNVSGKPSTFAPAPHAHDYLPLSGGTITGDLTIGANFISNNVDLRYNGKSKPYINLDNWNMTAWDKQSFSIFPDEAEYGLYYGVTQNMWSIFPAKDTYLCFGSPSRRWGQIYSSVAAISTSDQKQKKDINLISDQYIALFSLLQPVSYRLINGTSGRLHIGFISQDVEEAMGEVGLSALDFAGFCKDKMTDDVGEDMLDEDGNPVYIYSLRYEEFIALNTAVIQIQQQRIDSLEERLKKLEEVVESLSKQSE